MNGNLPSYHFMPAPLWIITLLHVLTLSLHFAAMNFLFGGAVAVLFGRFSDRWNNPAVKAMIRLFPSAMAATITLGVAPLLFVQLVYPAQVYSAAIVSAWFWLMVVLMAIVTYYFLYGAAFAPEGGPSGRKSFYLAFASLGMIYISLTYSSVFSLAERPDLIAALYAQQQNGLALNSAIGSVFLRWLHMMTGIITIGGFWLGLVGRYDEESFRIGKLFFTGGMVAAFLAGFSYLFSFADYIKPLMKSPAIWWLTVAILLSLGALHFFYRRLFLASGVMLFISLMGMVAVRHEIRQLQLARHFDPSTVKVTPQWSVFLLFLVCFVLALATLGYMIRLFLTDHKGGS